MLIPEAFFTAVGTGAAAVVLALPERHQVRARRALERLGATTPPPPPAQEPVTAA